MRLTTNCIALQCADLSKKRGGGAHPSPPPFLCLVPSVPPSAPDADVFLYHFAHTTCLAGFQVGINLFGSRVQKLKTKDNQKQSKTNVSSPSTKHSIWNIKEKRDRKYLHTECARLCLIFLLLCWFVSTQKQKNNIKIRFFVRFFSFKHLFARLQRCKQGGAKPERASIAALRLPAV